MVKRNHNEDLTQEAFFDWVNYQIYEGKPLNELCFAIPNGGYRNKLEAIRFKKQGVLSGVADIFLAIPKAGVHGLWIEFKDGDNKLSSAQAAFKYNVVSLGYMHVTCYSVEDAIEEVNHYLNVFGVPRVALLKLPVKNEYKAFCRKMSKTFKSKKAAVNWLRRRGFNEKGERI